MNKWIAGSVVGLCVVLAVVMNWVNSQKPEVQKVDQAASQEVQTKLATLQIPFIQNKGQMNGEVSFYAQTFAGTMFVTKDGGMVYAIQKTEDRSQNDPASLKLRRDERGTVIKESLVGGKILEIKGEGESVTQVNSFIGNDPAKWQRNIATFGMVNLGEVYPGIGLKLKAYGKNVEKLFEVKPGASPEEIRVKLEGSKDLKVNEGGELVASTEAGDIKFTKPIAYQEIKGLRTEVRVEYEIEKMKDSFAYGFKVGSYNPNHSLIIDPLLASTFVGGTSGDQAYDVAVDTSGNVYVTGVTSSSDYPAMGHVYGSTPDELGNVFISKLDNTLSIIASTFIGGNGSDEAHSIAVDGNGNVYITGATTSSDYPTTLGDAHNADSFDAFISWLSGDLSQLLSSRFLGGSRYDVANAIAVRSGEVYIAGETNSIDFPVVVGSYDTDYNDVDPINDVRRDAFVSKLSGDLSELHASAYMGGSSYDYARAIVVGQEGDVYVAGETDSPNFPYETGVAAGERDIFISKLPPNLTDSKSTRMGGSGMELVVGIAIDEGGSVFVVGMTSSADFPVTVGVYDTVYENQEAFIVKFDEDLSGTLASTFIGGNREDLAEAISLGSSGEVYIAGYTFSTDYPTVTGAYDRTHNGHVDAFISKLNNNLTALSSSTYLGGTKWDEVRGLAMDDSGNIYLVGTTNSADYPRTIGPSFHSLGEDEWPLWDVLVSKLTGGLSKFVDAPTSLNAVAVSSSSIVLSWMDQSSNERGFKIERKIGNCGDAAAWKQIKTVGSNAKTYRSNGRASSTMYSYRVRAYNANGNSTYSNCARATTGDPNTPQAPYALRAFSVGPSNIHLYWWDNSDNEVRFFVNATGLGNVMRPHNSTDYIARAQGNQWNQWGTNYSYAVKACRDDGCSPATNRAVVPFRPKDFATEVSDTYGIDLTWTDTSDRETGFEIQRKEGGCSSQNAWQSPIREGVNETSHTDNRMIMRGTTYGYQIRSYTRSAARPYAYGYSQWTQCVEETVPDY